MECSTTVAAARQQQGDQNVSAADIGYEQVAKAAFGSWGKACVSATIYAELFGICRCYSDTDAHGYCSRLASGRTLLCVVTTHQKRQFT